MRRRSSSSALISLPRRSIQTSAGYGSIRTLASRHGVGRRPRPPGAPAPTDETKAFIRHSRQGATRRRNVLTGSLAAGLVLALVLAGLAYWQRGVAVEQRGIAQQTRRRRSWNGTMPRGI